MSKVPLIFRLYKGDQFLREEKLGSESRLFRSALNTMYLCRPRSRV